MALAVTLAVAKEVSAHRSEDYLQAARIGLEPDRVLITLDLTPGIAVAESFLATVDRDRDGSLSPEEQREYAGQMVGALELEIDERPVQPHLVSWSFPEPSGLRRGEGMVRLELEAPIPGVSSGLHRFLFRNTHLAGHSVYLANALVPESTLLAVTAQRRDRDQTELTIEYTVHADRARSLLAWVLGGLAATVVIVGSRWTRTT